MIEFCCRAAEIEKSLGLSEHDEQKELKIAQAIKAEHSRTFRYYVESGRFLLLLEVSLPTKSAYKLYLRLEKIE